MRIRLPAGDSMIWPAMALCFSVGVFWFTTGHLPFLGPREIEVEVCDEGCAARGAGYVLAQRRRAAIDLECNSKGEDFAAGCADYWEEKAPEDLPEPEPDDAD